MRKYRYHVVTPFTRFENLVVFACMLREFGVMWHPVFNDDLPFRLAENDWIEPWFAARAPEGWNRGNWAFNWFLDHGSILDRSRYLLMPDDNFYEPGFFDKLEEREGELLICSMKRGHQIPPGGTPYGTDTLVAVPGNMHVGGVGGEQLIVSGRLLKTVRFGPNHGSDGQVIAALCQAHKPEFLPEAYVWFNYLEPGRWNK